MGLGAGTQHGSRPSANARWKMECPSGLKKVPKSLLGTQVAPFPVRLQPQLRTDLMVALCFTWHL